MRRFESSRPSQAVRRPAARPHQIAEKSANGGLLQLGRRLETPDSAAAGRISDAATAAHEQHRNIGDVDHRHAVVARSAWQLERAKPLRRDGLRHLAIQPWRALHAAVFAGDIDLKCKLAPLASASIRRTSSATAFLRCASDAARMSMVKNSRSGRLARLLLFFCGS
jgi:hypothetical protein